MFLSLKPGYRFRRGHGSLYLLGCHGVVTHEGSVPDDYGHDAFLREDQQACYNRIVGMLPSAVILFHSVRQFLIYSAYHHIWVLGTCCSRGVDLIGSGHAVLLIREGHGTSCCLVVAVEDHFVYDYVCILVYARRLDDNLGEMVLAEIKFCHTGILLPVVHIAEGNHKVNLVCCQVEAERTFILVLSKGQCESIVKTKRARNAGCSGGVGFCLDACGVEGCGREGCSEGVGATLPVALRRVVPCVRDLRHRGEESVTVAVCRIDLGAVLSEDEIGDTAAVVVGEDGLVFRVLGPVGPYHETVTGQVIEIVDYAPAQV